MISKIKAYFKSKLIKIADYIISQLSLEDHLGLVYYRALFSPYIFTRILLFIALCCLYTEMKVYGFFGSIFKHEA